MIKTTETCKGEKTFRINPDNELIIMAGWTVCSVQFDILPRNNPNKIRNFSRKSMLSPSNQNFEIYRKSVIRGVLISENLII
jgi:hypothetical protein